MQEVIRKPNGEQNSPWKRLILLVICWVAIFSLARDLAHVQRGFDRVGVADKRLAKEEAENVDLRAKLNEAQTDYYREKLMREKLNLQKPGETVVVVPDREIVASTGIKKGIEVGKVNWEKWLDLIR